MALHGAARHRLTRGPPLLQRPVIELVFVQEKLVCGGQPARRALVGEGTGRPSAQVPSGVVGSRRYTAAVPRCDIILGSVYGCLAEMK